MEFWHKTIAYMQQSLNFHPRRPTALSLNLQAVTIFTAGIRVLHFLARDVIYTSRAYATSVRLSVTQVHWHIIANLGFKFRSKFTAHCGRGEG